MAGLLEPVPFDPAILSRDHYQGSYFGGERGLQRSRRETWAGSPATFTVHSRMLDERPVVVEERFRKTISRAI